MRCAPPAPPSEELALVAAAQAGDTAALGTLPARRRASMFAVALAVLGQVDDAQDAVQDAVLTALARIGDVRDPQAVGAWLRMIVRNNCRSQLRRATTTVNAVPHLLTQAAPQADPQAVLERHAAHDRV